MKTIQCVHLSHHHNGFVASCRLSGAIDGVYALLVIEPAELLLLLFIIISTFVHNRKRFFLSHIYILVHNGIFTPVKNYKMS